MTSKTEGEHVDGVIGASHVQGNDVIDVIVWYCPLDRAASIRVSTPPFLIDCDFPSEILWEPPASVGLRMIVTSGSRLVFLKVFAKLFDFSVLDCELALQRSDVSFARHCLLVMLVLIFLSRVAAY